MNSFGSDSKGLKLEAKDFFAAVLPFLDEGKSLCLAVPGNSMMPFLMADRDSFVLRSAPAQIRKGDIAVFARDEHSFVLHRICKIKNNTFFAIGDAQLLAEGPFPIESIKGVAVSVTRKGKQLTPRSPVWQYYRLVHPLTQRLKRAIAGKRGKKV